jgi:hypothetical protein
VVGEPAQRGVLEFEVIRSFSGSGELEDERLPARSRQLEVLIALAGERLQRACETVELLGETDGLVGRDGWPRRC